MKLEYRDKKKWLVKDLRGIISNRELVIICHDISCNREKIEVLRRGINMRRMKLKVISNKIIKEILGLSLGSYIVSYKREEGEGSIKEIEEIVDDLERLDLRCLYVIIRGIIFNIEEIRNFKWYEENFVKFGIFSLWIRKIFDMNCIMNKGLMLLMKKWQH